MPQRESTRRQRRSRSAVHAASPKPTSKPTGRRAVEAEDLLCIVGISDVQIAPDGGAVAFVRTVANEEERLESSIWLASVDSRSAPRPLTRGTKDLMPRFSPDGRSLAFIRSSDERPPQVALLSLDGGEARILTRFPEGAFRSLLWSPDGSRLLVSHRTTEPEWTSAARKERERNGRPDIPRVIENRWHRLDGDGWFGNARHHLHLVDVRTGAATLIYDKDAMGEADAAWSPDGTRLAIATNRDPDALFHPWKAEILILDVASRRITPFADLGVAGIPVGPKLAIAWSPDGGHLAWAGRAGRDGPYSTENLELWAAPVPGRGRRRGRTVARSLTSRTDLCLLAPTLSDSCEVAFRPTILWRDDATVLTRIGWHGGAHLAAVPLDGGPPRLLTSGLVEHAVGGVSRDGRRVAVVRGVPTAPSEAGVLELNRAATKATWKPATALNRALCEKIEFVQPTEHWVTADDGHRTHVWVMRPPAATRSGTKGRGRRPAILQVHGGPHTQYGASFFHEFQLLAAQGYTVVYSNPRGSKGYGRDHCAAIRGNWGDRDWADVQAVTAFMQSLEDVDRRRIGIAGGSYGGYMTNWAIAHSKAYRAAVTDRCVSNLLSMAGNSDYALVPGEYWPGTNYENFEPMWRMSPIAHFKGVSTPTLIIHSEGDLRCNIEQAEQVHTALVLQGVPTRFVRYPQSTSHGMSRSGPPDMKLHRLRENLAWWKRWL